MKQGIWAGWAVVLILGAADAGRAEESLKKREKDEAEASPEGPDKGRPEVAFERFRSAVTDCAECQEFGLCNQHGGVLRRIRERLKDAPPEVREKARAWCTHHGHQIRKRILKRFDADGDGRLDEAERKCAREAIEKRHPGLLDKCRDRREDHRDGREDRRDGHEDRRDAREDRRDGREDIRDARYDGGSRDRIEDRRDRREDHRDAREDRRDDREDRRDAREDIRDARHDGGPRDRIEDRRDRREDRRDRRK